MRLNALVSSLNTIIPPFSVACAALRRYAGSFCSQLNT
jgi:hypothetical protein